MPPKVSVVMSVFNGMRYLPQAVESVLAQTLDDFEFILIDDASTDDSPVILAHYARQDRRIRLRHNPANLGLTRSLNLGLEMARGEYIARQDADDFSAPDRLARQTDALESSPRTILVSGHPQLVDEYGSAVSPPPRWIYARPAPAPVIHWYLLFFNFLLGHGQVMFRRAAIEQAGGYDESYRVAQDHELWLRLAFLGDIVILPETLYYLRLHDESISQQKQEEQFAASIRAVRQNLENMTGTPFSTQAVIDLNQFWQHRFAGHILPGNIHRSLRQIFNAYVRQKQLETGAQRAIRRLVRGRFVAWSRKTSMRSKIHLWWFALRWSF